jgi:UDP-N-acetyl-D-mannosaminuronate dehydrogenase
VPLFAGMRKYMEYRMHSVPLTKENVAAADCVLIVTNHAAIDWQIIAEHARLCVDSRNALKQHLPIRGAYVQA